MHTEIVSRVAELIRNPVSAKKVEGGPKEKARDTVELSATANQFIQEAAGKDSELERMQLLKVKSLEERIKADNYSMNEEMVDAIAEKILKML